MNVRSPFAWLLCLLLLLGLAGTGALPGGAVRAEEDDPFAEGEDEEDPFDDDDSFESPTSFTPEEAEKAILRGVTWLKKNQREDGSWGPGVVGNATYAGQQIQGQPEHPAGPTALAVYTLLKCKVSVRDPSVRRGFEFLRRRHEEPGGSYETSALLLAVCATANPYKTSSASSREGERLRLRGSFRGWAQKLQDHLVEKRGGRGWRYNVTGQTQVPPGGNEDLSSTQLACLALFAAHQVRIRTSGHVWEDILAFTLDQQQEDGPEVVTRDPLTGEEIRRRARGFCYIRGDAHPERGQPTGSMTACGIANLMMARFVLTDGGRKREEWDARPDAPRVQEGIEDALAWLEENWSSYANPRKQRENVYHLYWLYAVERAMDLVGNHRIGNHLWYSEMGQELINRQQEDGSWDSVSTHEPRKVLDTCFALLFLKKATQGQIPFPSITGGTDEPPVDNR